MSDCESWWSMQQGGSLRIQCECVLNKAGCYAVFNITMYLPLIFTGNLPIYLEWQHPRAFLLTYTLNLFPFPRPVDTSPHPQHLLPISSISTNHSSLVACYTEQHVHHEGHLPSGCHSLLLLHRNCFFASRDRWFPLRGRHHQRCSDEASSYQRHQNQCRWPWRWLHLLWPKSIISSLGFTTQPQSSTNLG